MTTTETPLVMEAGVPFTARMTITGGKTRWATLGSFEVRSQARKSAREDAELVIDLTPHLAAAFDGDDIVIVLTLSGSVTRSLARKKGYYDVLVSDPGATDDQALKVMRGTLTVNPVVTSAS